MIEWYISLVKEIYDTKREELYRQIRATNDSLRHCIKVLEGQIKTC